MTSASFRTTSVLATLLVGAAGLGVSAHEKAQEFYMVRAAKPVASGCLPNASATVRIKPKGPVEVMDVFVEGLPANTDFDFFVIQKPGAPFGLAWYQGDIETNEHGRGFGRFIGRFNEETFIVAHGLRSGADRCTTTPSRTRARIRSRRRSTRSTSACGSTRRMTPSTPGAPRMSRRSTASTMPAFRC